MSLKTKQAMDALMALTLHERGLVLCWFCGACHAYVGPGEKHRCREQEADAADQKKREDEAAHEAAVKMMNELAEITGDDPDRTTWPQLLYSVGCLKENVEKLTEALKEEHDATITEGKAMLASQGENDAD